jgi:hypothetical protein
MLFIFRKLRRSFFQPGKLKTYIAYAFGEIVLIVVGILIALQISDWNEARKNRATEIEILSNLRKDFVSNQEDIDRLIENVSEDVDELEELSRLLHLDPKSIDEAMFDGLIDSLMFSPEYSPADGVINSVVHSSNLSLVSDQELKYHLSQWPSKFGDYARIERVRYEFLHSAARPYFYEHYPSKNYRSTLTNPISIGRSRHSGNLEFILSDLKFENILVEGTGMSRAYLRITKDLREYQALLLNMLDEELNK